MPTDSLHNWPAPPHWAVTLGSFGKGLIFAALISFLLVFIINAFLSKSDLKTLSRLCWAVGTASLVLGIACLGYLFAKDQFEFSYVFAHGDQETDLRYKIAGIWSGQEGSFLLWACTSAIFGIIALRSSRIYERWYSVFYSSFLIVLCGIIAYESPFNLGLVDGKLLLPPTGAGLTPSLQNYWVTIHPPTIFSGFGSLTVAACFAAAAMVQGNVTDYVKLLRPYAIFSASILGLGLCFGGFWAYETLGWGGFWMWDPVENVSFVPWIMAVGLLHGIIVQVNRKQWYGPNLLLAGLPFLTFCYGTFLTRSGFLANASVHSFAEMNKSALWILVGFIAIATVGFISLWASRGRKLAREQEPVAEDIPGVHRAKLYASSVILLSGLAASAAIGMSVPFFLALANRQSKVVDEALYHRVVVWFFIPLMVLMAIAPFVGWKKPDYKAVLQRAVILFSTTVGVLGVTLFILRNPVTGDLGDFSTPIKFPFGIQLNPVPWVLFLFGLCVFSFIGNFWRVLETYKKSKMGVGGFVAHIGIAVLMAGLIVSRGFEKKETIDLQEGDTAHALGYAVTYEGMTHSEEGGLFMHDNKALFQFQQPGDTFTARPGLYYIQNNSGEVSAMVWPYLEHRLTHDIYITLFSPILDVWKGPATAAPGQTIEPEGSGMFVTYKGFKMVGPGGPGTKFIADVTVRYSQNGIVKTFNAQPSIEVTQQGLQPTLAPVGDDFIMTLESIDAASRSASLQLHFSKAIYRLDVFYKPLVGMVWLGAFLTFAGGALSAFYRRPPQGPKAPKPPKAPKNPKKQTEHEEFEQELITA